MKSISLFMIILSMSATALSQDNFHEIKIEDEIALKIAQRKSHRNDPYLYYDQSLQSIPQMHPNAAIVAKRRIGRLGEILYSIVCYKMNGKDSDVIIGGTSVYKGNALMFEAVVPHQAFGDSLLIVLEAVARISSNKQTLGSGLALPLLQEQ